MQMNPLILSTLQTAVYCVVIVICCFLTVLRQLVRSVSLLRKPIFWENADVFLSFGG